MKPERDSQFVASGLGGGLLRHCLAEGRTACMAFIACPALWFVVECLFGGAAGARCVEPVEIYPKVFIPSFSFSLFGSCICRSWLPRFSHPVSIPWGGGGGGRGGTQRKGVHAQLACPKLANEEGKGYRNFLELFVVSSVVGLLVQCSAVAVCHCCVRGWESGRDGFRGISLPPSPSLSLPTKSFADVG